MSDDQDPPHPAVIEAEALPPEPEATGVRPDQRETPVADAEALIRAIDRPTAGAGLRVVSIAGALQQLGERVSGKAASVLLQVSTARLESELAEVKRERDAARQATDDARAKLHEAEKSAAVLGEKLSTARNFQLLSNVLTTLGGIGLGLSATDAALGVFGGVLLVAGWIVAARSKK